MAMIFKMHMAESGERRPVPDARRFSHYIGNIRFWFAVHQSPENVGTLTVSHWESGKRVTMVSTTERIAGVGLSDKELAKLALDKLVAKHGAARVESVLRAAEA